MVDPDSGYRYYRITQLPLARRIRALRVAEMPLEAIHAALYCPTPKAKDAVLQEHERRIVARIAREQESLRLLRLFIAH